MKPTATVAPLIIVLLLGCRPSEDASVSDWNSLRQSDPSSRPRLQPDPLIPRDPKQDSDPDGSVTGMFQAGNFSYLIYWTRWRTVIDHHDLDLSNDSPKRRGRIEGRFLLAHILVQYRGDQPSLIPDMKLVGPHDRETEQSSVRFEATDGFSGLERVSYGNFRLFTLIFEVTPSEDLSYHLRVGGENGETTLIPMTLPPFNEDLHQHY